MNDRYFVSLKCEETGKTYNTVVTSVNETLAPLAAARNIRRANGWTGRAQTQACLRIQKFTLRTWGAAQGSWQETIEAPSYDHAVSQFCGHFPPSIIWSIEPIAEGQS